LKKTVVHIIRVLFFAAIVWFSWMIYDNSMKIQDKKEQNAVFFDVSRGVFNPNEWKCKVIQIINGRIDSLDINIQSEQLVDYVDSCYRSMTKDVRNISISDSLIDAYNNTSGNFFSRGINALSNFFSSGSDYLSQKGLDLILQVLEAYLLEKIRDNDTVIKDMIKTGVNDAINENLTSNRESSTYTPDCIEKEAVVLENYEKEAETLKLYLYLFVALALLYFAYAFIFYRGLENYGKIILFDSIVFSMVCLVLGVLLPMIEINAKIEDLQFTFLGETISFENQFVYFRSKSIFDIVVILFYNNIFVAVMIFAFSVLTPFTKLISSLLILYSEKAAQSKILKGIVMHIGKWSMADVFVVAIFLATLGYQGIISEQMQGIERIENLKTTLNTEQSSTDTGFYFFVAYVLISMVGSVFIKRVVEKRG